MKPHLPLRRKGHKNDSDKKNGPGRSIDSRRAGLAVATIAVLAVLLCWHLLPEKVSLRIGDKSPEDIRAHRSVKYLDTVATARARLEAGLSVGKVYDPVPYARQQALDELSQVFDTVSRARNSRSLRTPDARASFVRLQIPHRISEAAINTLLQAPEAVAATTRTFCETAVGDAMNRELRNDTDDLRRAQAEIDIAAAQTFGATRYGLAAAEVCKAVLRPTRVYDAERTAAERKAAERKVEPAYGEINVGQTVIRKDETVTQAHVDKFRALGLQHPEIDAKAALSLTLYAAFMVVLVSFYLARYQRKIYDSPKLLLLLSLVAVLSALALKLGGALLGIQLTGLQLAYVGTLSVTVAGMVLAVLLNVETAVVAVALLAVTTGLVMSNELRFVAMTMISGLVGIYGVSNIRNRTDLTRAGIAIAVANIALVWIVGGLSGDSVNNMLFGTGWGAAIGLLAVTLFMFGTTILERMFDITTHIMLMELADTDKPLLRKMVLEASGTYTHSIAVGQLAEAAAEAVGADALLARVASYYHDIGKLLRPQFFVENQFAGNIHDNMNPTLSALVITSHVKDGVEVAKEHKLPREIQDVILQHHGTSLVHYFYSQVATDNEGRSALLEQQFRYAGPKPQSREAAIVMLADSVEAATRALEKPTPATIESEVARVVEDKRRDGQLDESDLRHRDLNDIAAAFSRRLIGVLHARIEYVEPTREADGKKQAEGGDTLPENGANTDKDDATEGAGKAAAKG